MLLWPQAIMMFPILGIMQYIFNSQELIVQYSSFFMQFCISNKTVLLFTMSAVHYMDALRFH